MSMLIEVTSVAIRPIDDDEPVSPELALVDPILSERLRARLPDPLSEPEPERLATVHVLHADGPPLPDVVAPVEAPALAAPPVPLQREGTLRRALVSFVAGAVVSAVLVFGIMAELSERDATSIAAPAPSETPSLAPPTTPRAQTPATTSTPKVAPKKPAAKPVAPKTKAPSAKKQASATPRVKKAPAPKTAAPKAAAPKTGAAQAAPARRFAWAPVPKAVGYRFDLFRGDRQVLRRTTKTPTFELGATWRHQGRAERLGSGAYRWYVWPILPGGEAAAEAVVQAQLTVP